MADEINTLNQAIELVAAGSWAVDSALKCLEAGDTGKAQAILQSAQRSMRDGLHGLAQVLDGAMRDSYERPERLARALASLEELRDLSPARAE